MYSVLRTPVRSTAYQNLDLEISDFSVDPPCTATQNRDGVRVRPIRMKVIATWWGLGANQAALGCSSSATGYTGYLGVFM